MVKEYDNSTLYGVAIPEDYKSFDQDGNPVDLREAVFPILKFESDSQWKLIGTGFFITLNGIFLTAKHVLMDIIDDAENQKCAASILQLVDDKYYLRNIIGFQIRDNVDVAYGITAPFPASYPKNHNFNKRLSLCPTIANINESVFTYAYPHHKIINMPDEHTFYFNPQIYPGTITEYFPNGRDKVMANFPCYATSIVVHGGASGGPVFNEDGYVIGINSTGMQGADYSCATRIIDTFDLEIKNINIEGIGIVSKTIGQLMSMGIISGVKKKSTNFPLPPFAKRGMQRHKSKSSLT